MPTTVLVQHEQGTFSFAIRQSETTFSSGKYSLPSLVTSTTSDSMDPTTNSSRLPNPQTICRPADQDENACAHACINRVGLTPLAMVQNIASMAGVSFNLNAIRTLTVDSNAGQKRKRNCTDDDEDADAESLLEYWVARRESVPRPSSSDAGLTTWKPSSLLASSEVFERMQRVFLSRVATGGSKNLLLITRRATAQMQAPAEIEFSSSKEEREDVAPVPHSSSSLSKRDTFQNHMQSWIKANWQNPFPDGITLNHLANELIEHRCISLKKNDVNRFLLEGMCPDEQYRKIATEKTTTWLVNARTRRWRPSIEEAFDKKRPAALLFEDSLNIYQGKKLRPVDGWDGNLLFALDERYAAPLKTSTRKRSVRTEGENKRAGARKLVDGKKTVLDDYVNTPFEFSRSAIKCASPMSVKDNRDFLEVDGHLKGAFVAI